MKDQLPKSIIKMANWFHQKNIKVILIGGTVRDYLLNGQISNDFDFEIHPLKNSEFTEVLVEKIIHLYAQEFKLSYEKLLYGVFRVGEFELAMARVEKFTDLDSHKNFTAKWVENLDYTKSFSRRDLTINSIGYDILLSEYIDPFKGRLDIESRLLNAVNREDFVKDPVRGLRAIRFAVKLDFKISQDLEEKIREIKLQNLTAYYLLYESKKSNNTYRFFELLFKYFKVDNLNDELKIINKLFHKIKISSSFETALIVNCLVYCSELDQERLISYFQWKKKAVKWIKGILNNPSLGSDFNEKCEIYKISPSTFREVLDEQS